MRGNHVVQVLAWKESRQLIPLVLMLVSLQLVVGCILALSDVQTGGVNPFDIVSIGMPLAYAIGVGGYLIGQEKDSRSIFWLRSLPIENARILWSKSIAATAGLFVIWITSLLTTLVWRQWNWSNNRSNDESQFVSFVPYAILSVVVVWTGLAFAWRMRSAFQAFLWLLPTIVGIFLITFVSFDLFYSSNDEMAWYIWQSVCYGGLLPIASLFVFREGFRFVHSAETALFSPYQRRFPNAKIAEDITDPLACAFGKPPQDLWIALTRQTWIQNRLSYMLLTILMVVGAAFTTILFGTRNERNLPLILVCISGLVSIIAWMGAVPFSSERVQNRKRFLADRGASPFEAWLSRVAVPVTILLLIGGAVWLVLLQILSTESIATNLRRQRIWGDENRFLFAFCLWLVVNYLVFAIHGAGLWAGQLVRSPVIAMIVAPIFAWLMCGYAVLVFTQAETPYWLLPVFVLAPFLCTLQSTKLWLDDSSPFRFYRVHCMYLAAAFVLPWIPGLIRLVSIPAPPADTIAEWNRMAMESAWINSNSDVNKSIDYMSNNRVQGNGRFTNLNFQSMHSYASIGFPQRDALKEETKKRLLRTDPNGVPSQSDSEWLHSMFFPNLAYFRYMASLQAKSNSGDTEENVDMYRAVISRLIEEVQNARVHQPASAFCRTDQWECLLLNEALQPETASLLDPPTYRRAIELLKDDAARRKSRQRAVAFAYQSWEKSPTRQSFFSQFEAYSNIELFRETSMMRRFTGRRLTRHALYALWVSANATTNEEIVESNTMMDRVWGEELAYKEFFTTDPYSFSPPEGIWTSRPGGLWNKRWEAIAAELVEPALTQTP